MKKGVERAYFIYLIIIGAIFLYMLATFRLSVTEQEDYGYEKLEAYVVDTYEDETAPAGVRERYTFQVQGVRENYNVLMFYTNHQNVDIYMDGQRIYRMKPSPDNEFGKSPGYVWNSVYFDQEDNGKLVCVEIIPVYESLVGATPTFYQGNKFDIMISIIVGSLPSQIFSVLAIVMGAIFITFNIVSYKGIDDKKLIMLGCFSILIGIWKITDTAAFALLFSQYVAVSYLPFIALMMIGVPFIMYIKELHTDNESIIWYIPCLINLVQMGAVMFLQIIGIADMRQLLLITHIVIGIIIVVCCAMAFREIHKSGLTAKLQRNLVCMFACCVGAVVDIITYYMSGGVEVTVFGTVCFVIYICVLGFTSLQDARRLMATGMQAERYEKIAYHDQLTGLHNRSAYMEATADRDALDKCIVVIFDLNDLKKCNDELGHDKGDIYLKESARVISECFGDLGTCYRIGGDEFCAILRSCSLEKCRQRVALLKAKMDEFNEANPIMKMHIASGFEMYDSRIDYDISDTARRADKMMYRDKFAMKKSTAVKQEEQS